MPASHFDVKPMTGRPKFIVRHSTRNAFLFNGTDVATCNNAANLKSLNQEKLCFLRWFLTLLRASIPIPIIPSTFEIHEKSYPFLNYYIKAFAPRNKKKSY
jgi:hypothetical protein